MASGFVSVDLHERDFLLFQCDKLNEISSKTTNFFSVAEKIGSFVVKVDLIEHDGGYGTFFSPFMKKKINELNTILRTEM